MNGVVMKLNRRQALAAALPLLGKPQSSGTGLTLNEDPNHYFSSRAGRRVTRQDLTAWVDQYAGTQVRELLLCVNAQRTAFASRVWTPFWKGYDPAGPDDQPLFRSAPERASARRWVHAAWQMQQDGLDHLAIWIERARQKGISPWLSVRMNDLHNVDDEQHYLHSDFWRAHPEFRRVPYRGEMRDKALDFGHREVREYTFALIEEVARRYAFDGLELDWMRHGFHFTPGREAEGREHLNEFHRRARRLLGKNKRIGVRVPPHPQSAWRLGLDAVTWARRGDVDMIVPTNFWRTADTAMPIGLWRQLLPSTCRVGAGLELGLNAYPASQPFRKNDLASARGAAAAYLHEGADRIYLFNYMDSETAIDDLAEYPVLLRECGALASLAGKRRRHVVTYTDTVAPGEPGAAALPLTLDAGRWRAFRLPVGPPDPSLRTAVRIEPAGGDWIVRLNGEDPAKFAGGGEAVLEITARARGTIDFIEVSRVPLLQSSRHG